MLAALSATWLFSRLGRRPAIGCAWIALWTAAGYPLLGSLRPGRHGLHEVALCWPDARRVADVQDCRQRHGPALRCRRPLAAWHFLRTNQPFDRIHGRASGFDAVGEVFHAYRIPYYIMFALPLAAAFLRDAARNSPRNGYFAGPPYSGIGRHGMGASTPFGTWTRTSARNCAWARAIEEEDWESIPIIFREGHGRTHTAHGDEQEPGALQAGTRRRRNVPATAKAARRLPQRPLPRAAGTSGRQRRSITTTDW